MPKNTKSKKGFASMSPERLKKVASIGGKNAHIKGTAHRFTTEEARLAGLKGGLSKKANSLNSNV